MLGCLIRRHGKEGTEYFHRSVICMTVGELQHIILGQNMLKPRCGNENDESELIGGKRLLQKLKKQHEYFADVIVVGAVVSECTFYQYCAGMESVIRLKDEKQLIFKNK